MIANSIIAIAIGYLLGSIPFAYIAARLKKRIDIRQVGGRVPQAAALVNSLLKIKPIFTLNHAEARTVAIPRTIPSAIKCMLKMLEQRIIKGQPLHIAVMHADAPDRAVALKDRIASQFDCTELFITEFTPVMGVHTGPGLLGIAFYSGD